MIPHLVQLYVVMKDMIKTNLSNSWLQMKCKNKEPGGRLNKKDGLTRYGDSHIKDKTS